MKIFTSIKSLTLVAALLLSANTAFAGDGTKASPYTVAELNAQKDALAASGQTVWVKADLKGLGEDGASTDNATGEDNVKHMAGLFGDATGEFVAYSWQILGELALSDLTNTKDLLIALTYGTAGHPYGNSTYPQYASNEEPTDAHFSLEEVHGALSLTIQNGYRGYHIPACYNVPEGVLASTVTSNYSSSKGATISYKDYAAGEMIPKNAAMVLIAASGSYDIVLSAGLYTQTITNSNSLNGGTQAGVNTIPMKNNNLRYHYRFVATADKVGFERNRTESTEVELAAKDEVYLTVNGNDNHFYGNWAWETDDKNWISWQGTAAPQATEVLFDFANNNQNLPVSTGGANDPAAEQNAGNLGGKTITINGVAFSFVNSPTMCTKLHNDTKGTNSLQPRGIYFQMIKGGQIRITAPESKAVAKVAFVYNPSTKISDGSQTFQTNVTVEKGEGTLTEDKSVWTGNAKSVRFGASGAVFISSITVTLAGADDETVTPTADTYTDVTGLADFGAIADNTLVKLTLADAIVTSGMNNEQGYYVQDATAGAHFYCTGLEFSVGDKISGTLYVKKSTQQVGVRIAQTEETKADGLTISSGHEVTPIEGTIEQLNVAANICRVIKLTDVAVKGETETTATITDADGEKLEISNGKYNYCPYSYRVDLTSVVLAKAVVVGILYGAGSTNKLYPLSITEDTSGIHDIQAEIAAGSLKIYNLQGVRLNSLQKGVNIVNGKLIVTK